jgi:UDP-N-acetylmuramoyl-tripeptide--D-alanyl-D-alanine ligase
MGAKNIGDIKEICDIVNPEYGILTAIGPQHLETFKSLENVKKTKLELVDSLPENGWAFVNNEDENIKQIKFTKNNIKYGLNDDAEYYAYNIKINDSGSIFDVHTPMGEITNIKTKLLGEHSILNIVGAIAVAQKMNLNSDEIKTGIRFLKPVPHRLELKRNPNGLLIIDDAYNSNIKGAKMAVKTLGRFEDKFKVLITPGMVDLGEFSEKYNSEFGEEATKYCDFIILVGEKQAVNLNKGIEKTNYPKEKVYVAKDIQDAFKKLYEFDATKTVALLENDLPDNYL